MADVWLHIRADNLADIEQRLENIESYLTEISKTHNIKFNTSGISTATRQVSQLETAASRVESIFATMGSTISKAGTAMQGLGNLFGGRVVNTAKTMATAFATAGLYSAAKGGIERYDIMQMFPKRMKRLFGNSAEAEAQAEKAVDKLEQSVIGLPTGLDQIVNSANTLISLTHDLKRGTDLAIATNNAFLAGGADAQQVEYGQRQIRDLIAAGTLRTQEWDSMFKSLGAGLGIIAEEMGYSGKASAGIKKNNDELKKLQQQLKKTKSTLFVWETEGGHKDSALQTKRDQIANLEAAIEKMTATSEEDLGDFRNALKAGEISAEDFTNALIAAAGIDDEGNLGPLAQWMEDVKETSLAAAGANVGNAVKKLEAGFLDSINAVLVEKTGESLVQNVKNVSGAIKDQLLPALQGWVVDNSDKIIGFLDKLKNYDWVGLVSRVGKGLAQYYDIMTTLFTKVNPKVVAFLAVWAGPIGRALQTAGPVITGFGKVIGKLMRVFGTAKSAKAVGEAAKGAAGIGKIGTSLKTSFQGLALSAGFIALIGEIGLVIGEYAKIAEMISNLNIGSGFGKKMTTVVEVASGVAAFAAVLVGGFATVASSGVGAGIAGLAELLSAGFVGIIGEIGGVLIEFTHLANEISDVRLPQEGKLTDFFLLIADIGEALSETGGIGRWFKAWTGSKVVDNISKAMTSVIDIVDSVSKIQDGISTLQQNGRYGVRNGELDMSMITNFMDTLLQNVQDITWRLDAISTRFAEWNASKKAKSISKSIKSINDIIQSVADIQDSIAKTRGEGRFGVTEGTLDWAEFYGEVREVVDTMLTITEFIDNKSDLFPEWITTGKTSSLSKSITKINDILVTIGTMQDSISHLNRRGAFGVRSGLYDSELDFDDFTSYVTKIVNGMLDITQVINAHNDVFSGFLSEAKSQSLFDTIEHIGSVITAIAGIQTSIASMNDPSKFGVHNLGGGKGKMSMNSITKAVTDIIEPLGEMVNKFEEFPNVEDKVDSLKALGDSMVYVKMAITQIDSMQGQIDGLVDDNLAFSVGYKLQTIVESFAMFNDVASKNLSSLGDNVTNIKTAVDQIIQMMTALQQATGTIDGLVTGEKGNFSFTVGEKLLHAFTVLKLAFGIAKGSIGGEGSLTEVGPALQDIAKQLGDIGSNGEKAATNLSKAGGGVNELGEAAKTHGDTINKLAGYIKALKSALSGISSNASGAAGGIDEIGNAAARQVGNLYSAASAASSLASAINNIPSSKTVTMNVAGNAASGAGFSLGKTLGSIARSFFTKKASGGAVYGPGGIDNVPAWLTSGEFVMTKRAHSAFGSSFMNRINNLDVEGAMRALSLRAGSGILSRAKVTNNYTRDNHANVTFNVNRATQGYAQRRASRWARALS